MQVSSAISDVLVVLPPSASLRLPEFRHLHAFAVSDAKGFFSGGFLKVSFLLFHFSFLVMYIFSCFLLNEFCTETLAARFILFCTEFIITRCYQSGIAQNGRKLIICYIIY